MDEQAQVETVRGRLAGRAVRLAAGAVAAVCLLVASAVPAFATGVTPLTTDPTGGVANSVFQSIENVIFSSAVLAPLISLTVAFFILHFVLGAVKARRSKVAG